jgi:hypothetical protein
MHPLHLEIHCTSSIQRRACEAAREKDKRAADADADALRRAEWRIYKIWDGPNLHFKFKI